MSYDMILAIVPLPQVPRAEVIRRIEELDNDEIENSMECTYGAGLEDMGYDGETHTEFVLRGLKLLWPAPNDWSRATTQAYLGGQWWVASGGLSGGSNNEECDALFLMDNLGVFQ